MRCYKTNEIIWGTLNHLALPKLFSHGFDTGRPWGDRSTHRPDWLSWMCVCVWISWVHSARFSVFTVLFAEIEESPTEPEAKSSSEESSDQLSSKTDEVTPKVTTTAIREVVREKTSWEKMVFFPFLLLTVDFSLIFFSFWVFFVRFVETSCRKNCYLWEIFRIPKTVPTFCLKKSIFSETRRCKNESLW